jgi:hypothetical protein
MAQYKVPQDVEADDKLLGPFTFRQFVYLMIIGGLIGLGVLLWGVFPPLIIVLVPPILLLGALALPLKKDQPMETYLSAVVSFYLKPHVRIWEPGEPESTIIITAPKQKEEKRTKNLDQEEAMHRLSFLADIIDTEGYAIKGVTPSSGVKAEIYAEASNTLDMFDDPTSSNNSISQTLQDNASVRYDNAVNYMYAEANNSQTPQQPTTAQSSTQPQTSSSTQPITAQPFNPQPPALPDNPIANTNPLSDAAIRTNDTIVKPDSIAAEIEAAKTESASTDSQPAPAPDPNLLNLANNNDFSIETIAKQAKRIKDQQEDEVYISLH